MMGAPSDIVVSLIGTYVARRNVIVVAAWAEASESAGAYDRRVHAFVTGLIEAKLQAARLARRL